MCCNEEVSWAGALGLIGRNEEVDQVGMIWQGWECKEKSMQNAALVYKNERDESAPCMDIQDAISLKESEVQQSRHVRGNAALELELRNARERGHLFARKFQSSSPEWVDWIRKNLHESARTDA